jgi:hypothetical protein
MSDLLVLRGINDLLVAADILIDTLCLKGSQAGV